MTTLIRGQKTKLADIGCSGPFPLVLQVAAAGMEIDMACFGLDTNDKLSDDRYMVFFNQTTCPGDAVILSISADQSTFKINLAGLPSSIQKLVFTASITGTGSMRSIGASSLRLGDATFTFSSSDFQDEKAIIVGQIYQHDNQWRFGAVGQGFNGGLPALLEHFGGTEAEPAPTNTQPLTPEPSAQGMSTGTYEERLPCGGKLEVSKNVWKISYYFPGPDMRYNGTFVSVYGHSVEAYICAFNDNWAEYEQLKASIPSGGEFSKNCKMGMSIHVGGYSEGVCIKSYHMPIRSLQQLETVTAGYRYAAQRAPQIQKFLAST